MFKQTRNKITFAIMSILIFVFVGALSAILLSSYSEMYHKNLDMLKVYADMYAKNGSPTMKIPVESPSASPKTNPRENEELPEMNASGNDDTFSVSTFYAVDLYEDGTVRSIDNDGTTSYTNNGLINIAKELIASNKETGIKANLIYIVVPQSNSTLVVFMNNSVFSASTGTMFRYTLIFGLLSIMILFFLTRYLAKRIVQPLEESYQKQKQFISDAGHELKTPIAVVNANMEMLEREIGQNKWISNIQSENERMTLLISRLLQLARTEGAPPVFHELDFNHLVTGIVLPFESVAFEKGIMLDYELEENVIINGNEGQLGQLIAILIDNAIQYSTGDTVRIVLKQQRNMVMLSVSNEGPSIPEDHRKKIFERFYREDASRKSDTNHYGLGLSIAKAIVASHRGTIRVQCEGGITTFTVSLPKKHH